MAEKVIQGVPYFSQLDNSRNPFGSCNVTCCAMALAYFGVKGDGSAPQLEDQLYKKCLDKGWSRHDPYDLKELIESYPGVKDDFTPSGTIKDIQKAIDSGSVCILHGYFTRSGHIILVKGYDDTGLIVNDPYGEYFESGYDVNVSGEGLHYSYNLINRVCSPESPGNSQNIWLHVVSRKQEQK